MSTVDARHSTTTTGNGAKTMKNTRNAETPGASWV
jgi:hypothetical protein